MSPTILITGAYGRAGRSLARALAAMDGRGELVLCGRNEGKLQALLEELSDHPGISGQPLGLQQRAPLLKRLGKGAIWINAAPWPETEIANIADTVVASAATYLDIHPCPAKADALLASLADHPESPVRICLEAGISPGVPALIANALTQGWESLDRMTLDVAMRDPAIPDAGLEDILAHLSMPAMRWRQGQWRKAALSAVQQRSASPGFNGSAAPAWMPELDEFAQTAQPQVMDCYHITPSRGVGVVLGLGYASGLAKIRIGRRILLPLLRTAFARTQPPYGFAISGSASGKQHDHKVSRQWQLQFDELYHATAAPVVAAVERLLQGERPRYPLACFGNQFDATALLEGLQDGQLTRQ